MGKLDVGKLLLKPRHVEGWSVNCKAFGRLTVGALKTIDSVQRAKGEGECGCSHDGDAKARCAHSRRPRVVKVDPFLLLAAVGTHAKRELVQLIAFSFDSGCKNSAENFTLSGTLSRGSGREHKLMD